MGSIPGIQHQKALQALEKAGSHIVRQGKNIILSDGIRTLTIPRNNAINAFTMATIVKAPGLTVEQFRKLF